MSVLAMCCMSVLVMCEMMWSRSGRLLAAFDGFASDAPTCTSQGEKNWEKCYTIALFQSSTENTTTWGYVGRVDNTPSMPSDVEGPSEPALVQLPDGPSITHDASK